MRDGNGEHILIVPSWYPTDFNQVQGVFFRDQAQALRTAGVDVGVIYPEWRTVRDLSVEEISRRHFQKRWYMEDGIHVLRLHGWRMPPRSRRLANLFWVWLARDLIRDYVLETGLPDVIHAHGALWAGVAAVQAQSESRVPVVVTEHSSAIVKGAYDEWESKYVKCCYREAEAVVAVSDFLAEHMEQRFFEDREAITIPNVVNPLFLKAEMNGGGNEGNEFILLTVCLLTPEKGVDRLIRAFANVVIRWRQIQLVIVGDGPAKSGLIRLCEELEVQENVEFVGKLDREAIVGVMQEADLFVLASRVETFGVVIIEAMGMGLPVVSTASGGPEELVPAWGGIVVEPDNGRALAGAIMKMVETIRVRGVDRERLRRYVEERFSYQSVSQELRSLYSEVAGYRS